MKVTFINKSDSIGGAAVVTVRLVEALREAGVDARLLVAEKYTPLQTEYIAKAASEARIKYNFLAERLDIFCHNGFNKSTLFKIDTASFGLPLHKHPWVMDADIVCLNWVNQGVLSLEEIAKIKAPVVWTMHDMWNLTGICHHAGQCMRYLEHCGRCPLYGSWAAPGDPSFLTWKRKAALYEKKPIHFVAVSSWLAELAKKSSLLSGMPVSVIGNAFPIKESEYAEIEQERNINAPCPESSDYKTPIRLLMGAARLDDPIKGLPLLIEASRWLRKKYPEMAGRMVLYTFGYTKNPDSFSSLAIRHLDLGVLRGRDAIKATYCGADIVISSSLYETLPGTLVEGQAWGCIPVSFDRGGQSDIVSHGHTGFLCDFFDDHAASAEALADGIAAAAMIIDDKENAARFRKRMFESVVHKFSSNAIATSYITLFNQLTDSD